MSALFTPYQLGPVTLRNRTIRSAAFESMGRAFGPTEQLKEYHVAVARGGIGMTTLAYAAVSRGGLSFDKQLCRAPAIVPGLRDITDAVHRRREPPRPSRSATAATRPTTPPPDRFRSAPRRVSTCTPTPRCGACGGARSQRWRTTSAAPSARPATPGSTRWRCTPARLPHFAVPLALHEPPPRRNTADRSKKPDALHAHVSGGSRRGGPVLRHGRHRQTQHVRRIPGRNRNPREPRNRPRDRTLRRGRHRAFGRVRLQGPDGRDAGADPDLHDELLLAVVAPLLHPLVRPVDDPAIPVRGVLLPGGRQKVPRGAQMPAHLRRRAREPRRDRPRARRRVRAGADGPRAGERPGLRGEAPHGRRLDAAPATTATTASPAHERPTQRHAPAARRGRARQRLGPRDGRRIGHRPLLCPAAGGGGLRPRAGGRPPRTAGGRPAGDRNHRPYRRRGPHRGDRPGPNRSRRRAARIHRAGGNRR